MGDHGTEKSTSLELTRFGLAATVPAQKRKAFEARIAATLGPGRVYVTVETRDGALESHKWVFHTIGSKDDLAFHFNPPAGFRYAVLIPAPP
jgi:hypothetical protein